MKTKGKFKMLWASSYDRGLRYLLEMWSDIKKEIPEAELHIAYGFNLFDKAHSNNPYMMNWKREMEELMKQDGITHYGRLSKKDLIKLTKESDVWAYYCTFFETNCITSLTSIQYGAVPITMNRGALEDTAFVGTKIDADGEEPEAKQIYLKALVDAYKNPEWLEEQRKLGKEKISSYYWENIAKEWEVHFK
jgi:glycosyltransferase involved in cell wall biosynthesis